MARETMQARVVGSLAAVALLASAASVGAHATDPPELKGNPDVVHACVGNRASVVSLVDTTTGERRFGQTATHWGLTRPAGAPAGNTTVLAGGTCDESVGAVAGVLAVPGSCPSGRVWGRWYPVAGRHHPRPPGALHYSPVQLTGVGIAVIRNENLADIVMSCQVGTREFECSDLDGSMTFADGDRLLVRFQCSQGCGILTVAHARFSLTHTPP